MSTPLHDLLLNEHGFAFDTVEGRSYQLSPTALRLVRWMQEGESAEQALLRRLLEEHDVDEHTAHRDLGDFLRTAGELGWR